MKKSDLKKILKPLVNECIKESLLEDGLISGIIAEVVKGVVVTPSQPLVEAKQPAANTTQQVDISNLLGAVGTNWKAHMNEVKERK